MSKFTSINKLLPTVAEISKDEEERLSSIYQPLNDALGALLEAETTAKEQTDRLIPDLRPEALRDAILPKIRNLEAAIAKQQENIEASKALYAQETKKAAFPQNVKQKSEIQLLMDQLNESEIRKYLNSFKDSGEKMRLMDERLEQGDQSFLIAAESDPCGKTIPSEVLASMRDGFDIEIIKKEAPEQLKRQQEHATDAQKFDFIVWALDKKLSEKRKALGNGPNNLINLPFEEKQAWIAEHGVDKYYRELNL